MVVVEGDQNRVAAQNPLFVIPSLEYHDILSPLRTNNYDMVLIGRAGRADPGAEKADA